MALHHHEGLDVDAQSVTPRRRRGDQLVRILERVGGRQHDNVSGSDVGEQRRVELVVNGGFETGDFTGWTQSGGAVLTDDPFSGTYEASFAPVTGALAQNLGTMPNTNYTVSFYLRNSGNAAGTFEVLLGTSSLVNLTINPDSYKLFTYNATTSALPGDSTLTFLFANPTTTFHLDDVSVQAVPEPAAFAALGLGALGLVRRRRRA